MANPKHDETFRVIDRRLFTEEGELRKDIPEQDRRIEEPAARKIQQGAGQSGAKTIIEGASHGNSNLAGGAAPEMAHEAVAPEANERAAEAAVPGTGLETEPAGSRNFQMLVDFLARNAAAMLGGMPDPRTGQAFLDLEGAREMIDMLDGLRESTKGNLAKVDEDLLVEVIGSLKLTFMEISKAAAEQMRKKAQAKV